MNGPKDEWRSLGNSFISITCVTGGGRRDEKGQTTNEMNGNRMDG
jgi:hypothetical protein